MGGGRGGNTIVYCLVAEGRAAACGGVPTRGLPAGGAGDRCGDRSCRGSLRCSCRRKRSRCLGCRMPRAASRGGLPPSSLHSLHSKSSMAARSASRACATSRTARTGECDRLDEGRPGDAAPRRAPRPRRAPGSQLPSQPPSQAWLSCTSQRGCREREAPPPPKAPAPKALRPSVRVDRQVGTRLGSARALTARIASLSCSSSRALASSRLTCSSAGTAAGADSCHPFGNSSVAA
jgi:hypothetical protein